MKSSSQQRSRSNRHSTAQRLEFQWQLGDVTFNLVEGDIFRVSVDAIVNSDQTDFHLGHNPTSITGQIRRRYGATVQPELYAQTQRKTQPPGTVLKTSGGSDFRCIYHAGFHHPHVWLDTSSEENNETAYLKIIRSCVHWILEDFAATPTLNSVAFPLIGTGLFNLDPQLLAYEFALELAQFATSRRLKPVKTVWLVVYQRQLMQPVLNSLVQGLVDRASPSFRHNPLHLGVDFLDLFEKDVVKSFHPHWSAWLLARYAELLMAYLFYHLAIGQTPQLQPPDVLQEGYSLSFGTLRTKAEEIAKAQPVIEKPRTWFEFATQLIKDDSQRSQSCILRVNQDRNKIAHGKQFRPAEQIRQDLETFVQPDRWHDFAAKVDPAAQSLAPWLVNQPQHETAILDGWKKKKFVYLIPHTGETFDVPMP